MALDALLAKLEARAVTSVTADPTSDVTPKSLPTLSRTPVPSVTAENNIASNDELMTDPAMEARRQRVLAMLAERPDTKYAVVVDDPDADPVILVLAVRGPIKGGLSVTCELQIAREKYDPILLLDLIGRHGGTTH